MELKLDGTEQEGTPTIVPIVKHVRRFANQECFFSPKTVSRGLEKIHGSHPWAKGTAISEFNAAHSGAKCPWTTFKADETGGYAKYLHLGTTRVWKPDGTVDEARWEQLKAAVTSYDENKVAIVKKSDLDTYLSRCYEEDPQEDNTGRNSNSWFSSATVQSFAAIAAWQEVYDRLTCGWVMNESNDDYEPYITLELIRQFYDDSEAAFAKAESQDLPVSKPEMACKCSCPRSAK